MSLLPSLLAFSACSSRLAHLSAFIQSTNCSLKVSHSSLTHFNHPLFLLSNRRTPATLTFFSSRFSHFSHPIVHSLSHSLSAFDTAFQFGASRAVTLEGSTDYQSVDVPTRYVVKENAQFENCKFHALSSLRGDVDETSGGAIFSDGFDLVFKGCTFSGNAAVAGGVGAFLRGTIAFELCNFTNNRATFEAGALLVEGAKVRITESNFVQNEAELYVGVLKAMNSTVDGETIIFHANHAVFQSAVIDLEGSTAQFTAAQFSGNTIDNDDGGVVHSLRASTLSLRGCNFETVTKPSLNGSVKQPIHADTTSQVHVKHGCFDTPEETLRGGIEGDFSSSIGTVYATMCHCTYVVLPQPYDVLDKELTLEESLLTTRFIVTAAGLIVLALVIIVLVVCDGSNARSRWIALI
jgi:hypothetical protein